MWYVGSKEKLSKELVPIIQSYVDNNGGGKYLEPFCGSCAIIEKIKCETKIACDIKAELIALLKEVQTNGVKNFPSTISREEYTDVRNNRDNFPLWYVGLVGFCASYNAKFFGGYANNIKTKIGRIRNYTDESIRNLCRQAPRLKGIKFAHTDFRNLPKDKLKNYVIYCDIPYRNSTKYSTKDFPYEDFYTWCRELCKDNIILVSEYNMPDDFECIWEKEVKTSLHNNRGVNNEKTNRVEKLFVLE